MHLNIYELICFKLGMMKDTVVLYILILIYLALTFIQSHRSARKLLRQLSHKVLSGFEVEFGTLLRLVDVMNSFYLVNLVFKGENLTLWLLLKHLNIGL